MLIHSHAMLPLSIVMLTGDQNVFSALINRRFQYGIASAVVDRIENDSDQYLVH